MIETQISADGRIWLRAFGDLDWTAALALRHVVEDSNYPGARLVMDLGNVESIEAVAVSALVGSERHARSMGGGVQIVNAHSRVRTTFQVAGVDDLLLGSEATTDDVA